MQRRASGLLGFVALVFVAMVVVRRSSSPLWSGAWSGYVQAFAEAAMVGALADWFAVTALFRHPLGLPIPHTAIVPRRKDAIGASLGTFVQTNFLDADNLAARTSAAQPAQRFAAWLAAPSSRTRVAEETARALVGLSGVVDDDEVSAFIEQSVVSRLEGVSAAPVAARALEIALAEGRDERVIDAGLAAVIRVLTTNRELLRSRFAAESPWWVPGSVDERVFERLYGGVVTLLSDVRNDHRHPLRANMQSQLNQLVVRLRTDPATAAKLEEVKFELLGHPTMRAWSASLWAEAKQTLADQASNPQSVLRVRLDQGVGRLAQLLLDDAELRTRIDATVVGAVRHVSIHHGHEIATLIRTTVERWDAQDTSRRIELQIGRDLQFIRINGTLVGGLAGLVIHAVGELAG